MAKSIKHKEMIDKIKKILLPVFDNILVEKEGVGLIQIFDEKETPKGEENRFKIAYSDMIVLDEKRPFLVIEPETSSSPKTFGRSFPIYTIAKKVKIKGKEYPIESPLLLLIVIPNQPMNSQKDYQLIDLEKKLKRTIDLKNSPLRDFALCQIKDVEFALKKLLMKNGYEAYARRFG